MQGLIFLFVIYILFSKFKGFAEKIRLELEESGQTFTFNETPPGGFSTKKWYRTLNNSFVAKKAKGNTDKALSLLVKGKFTIENLNKARSIANKEAGGCLSNKNAALFYSDLIKRINDETRKLAATSLNTTTRAANKAIMDDTLYNKKEHHLLNALKNPKTIKQAIIMAEILKPRSDTK
jgi:hypothetical protein